MEVNASPVYGKKVNGEASSHLILCTGEFLMCWVGEKTSFDLAVHL